MVYFCSDQLQLIQEGVVRTLEPSVSTLHLLFFSSLGMLKLMELLSFKGKEKTFYVAELVGTMLGIILVNDETEVNVEAFKKEYLLHAEDNKQGHLYKMDRVHPVSWSTLTDVMRKIGLGTLASDIECGL